MIMKETIFTDISFERNEQTFISAVRIQSAWDSRITERTPEGFAMPKSL